MKLILEAEGDELHWFESESNLPILGSESFLKTWNGAKNPDYFNWLRTLKGDSFEKIRAGTDALLIGDGNWAFAPVIGSLDSGSDARVLVLVKWVGAPQGFQLPAILPFGNPKILQRDLWETTSDRYWLGEAADSGDEIMEFGGFGEAAFFPGRHQIRYFQLRIAAEAEFGFYIIDGIRSLSIRADFAHDY